MGPHEMYTISAAQPEIVSSGQIVSKKNCVQKKILGKQIWVQKTFGSEKTHRSKKKFWSKKLRVQNFGFAGGRGALVLVSKLFIYTVIRQIELFTIYISLVQKHILSRNNPQSRQI